jgi:hypothetical protein
MRRRHNGQICNFLIAPLRTLVFTKLHLLWLHLPQTRKSLLWVALSFLGPAAKQVIADLQVTCRLNHRSTSHLDQPGCL